MNTLDCPIGYSCSMYPAWGPLDFFAFFGGLALLFIAVVAVLWFLTR